MKCSADEWADPVSAAIPAVTVVALEDRGLVETRSALGNAQVRLTAAGEALRSGLRQHLDTAQTALDWR